MGKLFAKPPSEYFELEDQYLNLAIDIACASAHWEDENYHHSQATATAQDEAGSIDAVLEEYKNQR